MKTSHGIQNFWLALGAAALLGACGGGDDDDALQCAADCSASACQTCQMVDGAPVCATLCGDGLTCEAGRCVAPAVAACSPACDACQWCDTSGAAPACVDSCGEGLACERGVCVSASGPTVCEPTCGPCQQCVLGDDGAACQATCAADQACNEATNTCVRAGFHTTFEDMDGPFTDGPSVTQVCVGCHLEETQHVMNSPHYRWLGATPNLEGHETGEDVGKRNLVNNFCVSIPGNEKRCSQCHAGYGYDGPDFDFDDVTRVDCLVCHADPASGYKKAPKTAGGVAESVDLLLAAQSVGATTRANCGSCHFGAGGGDNVKKGDMGSALAHPSHEVDVHMGAGMTCSNCHADTNHTILGQGVHLPTSMGRLACEDCHGERPHEALSILDDHARNIACQTCHVPAFSRQQPTKMAWDWSTAGNKTIGTEGIATETLSDGTVVQSYNYMKGDFVWAKGVAPTLAWYDGRANHLTLDSSFGPNEGASADNPIVIARPIATKADLRAKIFPFKVMTGRQPAHLSERVLLAPKLFGPGGFWPRIPDPADYSAAAVRALWTDTLSQGARLAGQIGAAETLAEGDWDFRHTVMYLGINHEVAPKEMALGQPPCSSCHMNDTFPWADLGYDCDPLYDAEGCGARGHD